MPEQVATGVPGLDEVLLGGLGQGHAVLIEGSPGTGKTTLGLQMIYHGVVDSNEPALIVTFEEMPQRMIADAANFGWDLQSLIDSGKLRLISTSPKVFQEQMTSSTGAIYKMALDMEAKRILVDSVSHFERVAESSANHRELFNALTNRLRNAGFTALLTKEVKGLSTEELSFEEYVVDSCVRVSFLPDQSRGRKLQVVKARGQDFLYGLHSMKISSTGVEVFPNRLKVLGEEPDLPEDQRYETGVEGLDEMLYGGLLQGTCCLVAGSAGTGKSLLGISFLSVGARLKQPGLLVTFVESPEKARAMAIKTENPLPEDQVDIMYVPMVNLDPYEVTHRIRQACEQRPYKRLVIDSLEELRPGEPDEQKFKELIFSFTGYARAQGVTQLLIDSLPNSTEILSATEAKIAFVMDTIITLRHTEVGSQIKSGVAVPKMRGSQHNRDVRRFQIGSTGLQVDTRQRAIYPKMEL